MERFTSSSTDAGCRSNSRRMSMSIPQSTGSMLDATTSHQPNHHRRQSFVRGSGLERDNSARRRGLLGSFRRMSMDQSQLQQPALQGEDRTAIPISCSVLFLFCFTLAAHDIIPPFLLISPVRGDGYNGNDDDTQHISTVMMADYQEVFQKMKQTFPTSASGALHQITMARIAKLKAARDHEEQRERERLIREEEEERLKTTTMAAKTFNKWREKIMHGNIPVQQVHQDQHEDSTPTPHHHHTYNDPISAHQQHTRDDFNISADSILSQFIPIGSRPSILMRNLNVQDSRRTSMDSGAISGTSRSKSTSDDVNLALRSSVHEFDDAKSILSLLSDASGLFDDDERTFSLTDEKDEEEDEPTLSSELLALSFRLGGDPLGGKKESKSERRRSARRSLGGRGGDDDVIAVGHHREAFGGEGDHASNRGRTSTSLEHRCDVDSDDIIVTHVVNICMVKDAHESRSTAMSVASGATSDWSRASSRGLIVGFSGQRTASVNSGDDLIVGFVDRSESTHKKS